MPDQRTKLTAMVAIPAEEYQIKPSDGHFLKEILESVHFCVYGRNSLTDLFDTLTKQEDILFTRDNIFL